MTKTKLKNTYKQNNIPLNNLEQFFNIIGRALEENDTNKKWSLEKWRKRKKSDFENDIKIFCAIAYYTKGKNGENALAYSLTKK